MLCEVFDKCMDSDKLQVFTSAHLASHAHINVLSSNRIAIKPFLDKIFRFSLVRISGKTDSLGSFKRVET